jgi:hypothetical protein
MKYKYLIGIDPDLHKSGFAVYSYKENKIIECKALYLWQMFDNLTHWKENETLLECKIKILLEYPKNTNTYHAGGKGAALNVGKNMAIAIVIKEFLEYYKFDFELKFPAGYSDFFIDVKFFKKQTGWTKQTNEDVRAACAIIWINK